MIQVGDAIFCDFGVRYLGLYTDVQEWGYVPRSGERSAPHGLRLAMSQANMMQDLLMRELRPGRTGNEIQADALAAGRKMGLGPRVYSHPIGLHVHGAGSYIGTPDRQDPQHQREVDSRRGDFPVISDTVYAIELSIDVPIEDWEGQVVRFPVEQLAFISSEGSRFLGGRQEEIYLVD